MKSGEASRAYNQVARAEARERTRERLLDVAEATFFAGRWQQAPLEEMAAEAGVTKQTLLRHFGSKDGLRDAAMRRGQQRVRDQRWSAPTDDVAGAVDNLVLHYEEVGERAIMIGRLAGGGQADAELIESARQMHYDWVDYAFGTWLEPLRGPATTRRRAALIALCDVNTWWLLARQLALPRAEVRATLIDAIERLVHEEQS